MSKFPKLSPNSIFYVDSPNREPHQHDNFPVYVPAQHNFESADGYEKPLTNKVPYTQIITHHPNDTYTHLSTCYSTPIGSNQNFTSSNVSPAIPYSNDNQYANNTHNFVTSSYFLMHNQQGMGYINTNMNQIDQPHASGSNQNMPNNLYTNGPENMQYEISLNNQQNGQSNGHVPPANNDQVLNNLQNLTLTVDQNYFLPDVIEFTKYDEDQVKVVEAFIQNFKTSYGFGNANQNMLIQSIEFEQFKETWEKFLVEFDQYLNKEISALLSKLKTRIFQLSLWAIPNEWYTDVIRQLKSFGPSLEILASILFELRDTLYYLHQSQTIVDPNFVGFIAEGHLMVQKRLENLLNLAYVVVRHPHPIWITFTTTCKGDFSQRTSNFAQNVEIMIIGLSKFVQHMKLYADIVKIYDEEAREESQKFKITFYDSENTRKRKFSGKNQSRSPTNDPLPTQISIDGVDIQPKVNNDGIIKLNMTIDKIIEKSESSSNYDKRPAGVSKRRYSLALCWQLLDPNTNSVVQVNQFSYPFFILCKNDYSMEKQIIIERGFSNIANLIEKVEAAYRDFRQIDCSRIAHFYHLISHQHEQVLIQEDRLGEVIKMWFKKSGQQRTLTDEDVQHLLSTLKQPTPDHVLKELKKCLQYKNDLDEKFTSKIEFEKAEKPAPKNDKSELIAWEKVGINIEEPMNMNNIGSMNCTCISCRTRTDGLLLGRFLNHVVATRLILNKRFLLSRKNRVSFKISSTSGSTSEYIYPSAFLEMLVRQEEITAKLRGFWDQHLGTDEDDRPCYYIYGFLDKDSVKKYLDEYHTECMDDGEISLRHQYCHRLLIRFADTRYSQIKIQAMDTKAPSKQPRLKAAVADYVRENTTLPGTYKDEKGFESIVKAAAEKFQAYKVYPESDSLYEFENDYRKSIGGYNSGVYRGSRRVP